MQRAEHPPAGFAPVRTAHREPIGSRGVAPRDRPCRVALLAGMLQSSAEPLVQSMWGAQLYSSARHCISFVEGKSRATAISNLLYRGIIFYFEIKGAQEHDKHNFVQPPYTD